MVKLLEKAFAEVSKLSEAEQNVIAAWILDELASERRWDKAFSQSEKILELLADEALEANKAGRTKPLITEKL